MDDLLDVLEPKQGGGASPSLEELEIMMMANSGKTPPSTANSSSKQDDDAVKGPRSGEVTDRGQASRPTTRASTSRGSVGSGGSPGRASPVPLFDPIPEEEPLLITDEPHYRKPIFAADFVDFDDDMCKTPRFIRPPTEQSERPSTADSWISSTLSEPLEEEEQPLDTWVDEPRLTNAFWKIRDAFTAELGDRNNTVRRSDTSRGACFSCVDRTVRVAIETLSRDWIPQNHHR